ncbi:MULTISPECIES: efflux RND transporter periplasmic adaptor subunit [Oligella]|uniref:RND transporter n=2 Tax=Oligella urethralis TaxID=90245 RepID=A0A095ZAA7_9BURK|nr:MULTISPECIES: efflux RND transporter periplasmic adaptor subunit [Oligella]AVL71283.1 efflux RND transporter periplasmic adaptor subunit [Oligella urethralis]KGF31261.1 RND transporter [Oligella urethralis DNF00040]OFV47695.1 efflux transporter periplasmic adaptor subunit [Oligella sp. HMSC09E12]WOS37939.1 Multidrug efflux pump subunit AcrA [Oligella urethralis]SPY06950.1 Acriflavine resistance protein A precursor [Oligella urethralis]
MKINQAATRGLMVALSYTAFLTLSACSEDASEQQAPPPMAVSVVEAKTESTKVYTTLPARVNALKDAQILARVTGNIESIEFEQGGRVSAGQLLFKIDPKPYQAAYNQAAASLKQAQATARSANALAKRYRGLVNSSAISRQEYDDAMAKAGLANASVEQAQAALNNAEIKLGYTKVESPIDGIVGPALVTEGALVSESSGSPLAIVQQLDKVYVDFNQTVNELSQLRRDLSEGKLKTLGDGVAEVELVMDDGSLYPNKGQLLFTGVQVNPGTGQVQLRATFPNPDHYLLPGMYLQVRLARASVDDAIFVPNQAIQRTSEGGSKVMLVDEENVVRDSPVVLGQEFGGRTLVLSGVKVGDKVITEGFTKIRTGQTVRPQLKGAAQQAQQEQQAQPAETAASQAPAEQSEQGADTEAAAVAQ